MPLYLTFAGDADHGHLLARTATIPQHRESDAPSQRILVGEQPARAVCAQDDDRRRTAVVSVGEESTTLESYAERGEVSGVAGTPAV